jgi:predicted nucleotidyltransferase
VITLPEKLRKVLESTFKELAAKENAYGVRVFGSWSRGDAEISSDIDLFTIDRNDLMYKYVERI